MRWEVAIAWIVVGAGVAVPGVIAASELWFAPSDPVPAGAIALRFESTARESELELESSIRVTHESITITVQLKPEPNPSIELSSIGVSSDSLAQADWRCAIIGQMSGTFSRVDFLGKSSQQLGSEAIAGKKAIFTRDALPSADYITSHSDAAIGADGIPDRLVGEPAISGISCMTRTSGRLRDVVNRDVAVPALSISSAGSSTICVDESVRATLPLQWRLIDFRRQPWTEDLDVQASVGELTLTSNSCGLEMWRRPDAVLTFDDLDAESARDHRILLCTVLIGAFAGPALSLPLSAAFRTHRRR